MWSYERGRNRTETAMNTLHMHLYGDHVERLKKRGVWLPKSRGHKKNENVRKTGQQTTASH